MKCPMIVVYVAPSVGVSPLGNWGVGKITELHANVMWWNLNLVFF